jgi:CubicO group peptidase (beta-lactamase class C family)
LVAFMPFYRDAPPPTGIGEARRTPSPDSLPASQEVAGSIANRWRTLDGEPRDGEAADSVIAELIVEHRLRAISVAVVQDGQIVFSTVHGEVRRSRPADTNTVFRGASLGKPVFAYLVLKLVDEGVLDLDSPIDTFLPRPLAEYEHYSVLAADPRHRGLTVRRLLSQQSGLPNWHRGGPIPLAVEPGTRFGYSSEGYRLLQLVVEERTGRAVNDLAQEKVFEPLGMAHSSFLWELRFNEHFAVDLGAGLGPLIRQTRERANVAGSLITNAADYARFLLAVIDGRGLSPASHTLMLEPQIRITSRSIFSPAGTNLGAARAMQLYWTLGWGRFGSERGAALFHVGREEGCEGYAVVFLEPQTALVVMSVSRLQSTFTPVLAAGLLGDTYSPLNWLEYWRTADAPPSMRTAILVAAVALIGLVTLVAAGIRRRQQRMRV